MRFSIGPLYHLRPENAKRVGPIFSQAEHLRIVQSAGKDVSVLVDAAILDHRVLAGTDGQMGAGHHPG